jgi:hypothetical protein
MGHNLGVSSRLIFLAAWAVLLWAQESGGNWLSNIRQLTSGGQNAEALLVA